MRPNFWPNTPDILPEHLQHGGPPMFKIRAVLATMLSPSWGMYSGLRALRAPARPGSEEYLDNEKYQLRPRDWAAAEAAGRVPGAVPGGSTRSGSDNPALHWLRNLASTTSTTSSCCASRSATRQRQHRPGRGVA